MKAPKLSARYPSRSTIARMSRDEVQDRLAELQVVLPPLQTNKWTLYAYHPDTVKLVSDYEAGIIPPDFPELQACVGDYMADIEKVCALRVMAKHAPVDTEHPQAREELFKAGLAKAVQKESAAMLGKIISTNLRDEGTAKGCPVWSHWMLRTYTRPQKEQAVIQFLAVKDTPDNEK